MGRGSFISEKFNSREAEKIEIKTKLKDRLTSAYGFGVKREEILEI